MAISLVMFTQDGERRDFEVVGIGGVGTRAIIGRMDEADIQINLEMVSRQHCEVSIQGDKLQVRDLGSSNGTFVNNRRVQEALLGPGETITVGPVIFTVLVDGKPADIVPVRTIVDGKKRRRLSPPKPAPASNPLDDTGTMEIFEDDSALAELAALSKQKGKTPHR